MDPILVHHAFQIFAQCLLLSYLFQILSVDIAKKRVRLTCKPSLLNSDLQILSDLTDAKVGSTVQGVIVKITTGALVCFYNNVTVR